MKLPRKRERALTGGLHLQGNDRTRLMAAALVSVALHAIMLSLPLAHSNPRQANAPTRMTILPVEIAAGMPELPFAPLGVGSRPSSLSPAPEPRASSIQPETPIQAAAAPQPAGPVPGPSTGSQTTAPQETGASNTSGLSSANPSTVAAGHSSPASRVLESEGPDGSGGTLGLSDSRLWLRGGGSPGGGTFVHAKAIQAPKPPYPEKSRRRGEEGTVRLKVQVLPSGSVGGIEVVTSSGLADLEQAAIECVRQEWKFTPATLDGKATDDTLSVRFVFRQE